MYDVHMRIHWTNSNQSSDDTSRVDVNDISFLIIRIFNIQSDIKYNLQKKILLPAVISLVNDRPYLP